MHIQIYDFIKYMTEYNHYLKFYFKRIRQFLPLDLIYGNLIYLWNQAKICALQEREFRCVLRSDIWWFDALNNTFDLSSKCC